MDMDRPQSQPLPRGGTFMGALGFCHISMAIAA